MSQSITRWINEHVPGLPSLRTTFLSTPLNDVLEFDKARSFALKRLIKAAAVDRDFWKARSLTWRYSHLGRPRQWPSVLHGVLGLYFTKGQACGLFEENFCFQRAKVFIVWSRSSLPLTTTWPENINCHHSLCDHYLLIIIAGWRLFLDNGWTGNFKGLNFFYPYFNHLLGSGVFIRLNSVEVKLHG